VFRPEWRRAEYGGFLSSWQPCRQPVSGLWRPRQLRVELGERFLKKAQQSVVSVIDERQKFQRP
jgi:hypothetical protein